MFGQLQRTQKRESYHGEIPLSRSALASVMGITERKCETTAFEVVWWRINAGGDTLDVRAASLFIADSSNRPESGFRSSEVSMS